MAICPSLPHLSERGLKVPRVTRAIEERRRQPVAEKPVPQGFQECRIPR